jgi:hypothetical protein
MPDGTLLHRRALYGEACYRVVGFTAGLVCAEVVSAPGLPSGLRVHFTEGAARRMSLADAPEGRPGRSRRGLARPAAAA